MTNAAGCHAITAANAAMTMNAGHGSVQIVSITSQPIWPLVEAGRFLEGLFYRLNVVTLEASDTLM